MLYSIPAHKSLISHVKFEPQEGYYLATSSYDTKAAVSFIHPYLSYCFTLPSVNWSHIFHIFSFGQLGITNRSKVWWATSQRLLVWTLVEVIGLCTLLVYILHFLYPFLQENQFSPSYLVIRNIKLGYSHCQPTPICLGHKGFVSRFLLNLIPESLNQLW